MPDAAKVTVRVSHRYNVSPERVFDAWLDPQIAGKWLFATTTGQIVKCEIDARVGGTYAIARREGRDIFEHVGEYFEIERPRRLVFTFGVPRLSPEFSRVTIEIVPVGNGCELTLTNEGVLHEYGERTTQGWGMILAGLERQLAG